MGDNKLSVELTGDNTSLMSSLDKATSQINAFSKEGAKSIEGMGGAFSNLSGAFSAIKGAIAGLAIFETMKTSVDAAVELGGEVRRLSAYFQISSERAGELAEALKRMGSSPDDFIAMSEKMTKQIQKNEANYEKYGIKVKEIGEDGKAHWRPQLDIMTDVGTALNKIEGSTARNVAAQELLGKGGKEAATYLAKLSAAAKASQENLEAMGVAIDYESLKAGSKEYAKSQADIAQGFNVMKVVVGQELLPSLNDLMRFFSGVMGPAVSAVSWGVKSLTTAFWTLKYFIEDTVGMISDGVLKTINAFAGVGKVAMALLHGDFAGAKAAFEATTEEYKRIDKETNQVFADNAEDYGKKILRTWGDGIAKKKEMEAAEDGGKVTPKDDREKDQAILEAMKARLEAKRAWRAQELGIDRDYFQLNAQETLAFWRTQETQTRGSMKVLAEVKKEESTQKRALLKEDDASQKAALDKALAEAKGNYAEQIKAADAYLASILAHHRAEEPIYQEALKKRQDILNKQATEEKKYEEEVLAGRRRHEAALMDLEIEQVQGELSLGKVTDAQALAQIASLNERKYRAELAALQKSLALANLFESEKQKIRNDIQALDDRHNAQILKQNQAMEKELRKNNPMKGLADGAKDYLAAAKDKFTQFKGYITNILGAAESSVQGALKGLITQQQSFGEAMKGIWTGISGAVLDALTNMIAKWAVAGIAAAIFGTATAEAQNVQAAAALDTAVAESFSAYAWMPFVGFGLGAAQAALIEETFLASKLTNANLTAFATGGVVDKPTMGLIGEAGKEYIVPDRDMKSLLPSLVAQGAAMYGAILKSQSRVSRDAGSTYTPSKTQITNNRTSQGPTINVSGVIGDKMKLGAYIKGVLNDHTMVYGSAS